VIGSLKEAVMKRLFDIVGAERVALDLSEVPEAEAAAVRLLAQRPPGLCQLVCCPKWLAFWIEQERRRAGSESGT